MGYTIAAYPLTLLSASIKIMHESLQLIKEGKPTYEKILSFSDTKDVVGFTKYAKEEERYKC
jgi:2-methylisocitrate lyase-like PEP mutase family enzyme